MVGFPLIRLASLFVKRLSIPLTNKVKQKASEHPKFRQLCVRSAEFYHKKDVNIRKKVDGTEGQKYLSDNEAVKLGTDLVGEVFLYSFFVFIMYLEHKYATRRNLKKEGRLRLEMIELEAKVDHLERNTLILEAQERELRRLCGTLEQKNYLLEQRLSEASQK